MKKSKIKSNIFLGAISSAIGIIVPIITFPYFGRILLPEGNGLYAFLTSFVSYFYIFATLGIQTYGIIYASKIRDNKEELSRFVSDVFFINLFFSIFSYLLLFILMFFIPKIKDNKILVTIIAISTWTTALNLNWLVQAEEKYKFLTIKNLIFSVFTVVFLFIFVRNKDDLLKFVLINCSFTSISNIINFIYAKHFFNFKIKGTNFKKHFKFILFYFAISLTTSIFTDIDKLIIGFVMKNSSYWVGIYSAAYKINLMIIQFIIGATGVVMPRISYLIENNKNEEADSIMKKIYNYVLLFSSLIVVYLYFFGSNFIIALLGNEYIDSIKPMYIFLPIITIKTLTNLQNIYMLSMKKEKEMALSLLCVGIFNIVINLSLIYSIGIIGVVIATLLSELLLHMIQFFIMKDKYKAMLKEVNYKKIFIMLPVVGITSFLLKKYLKLNIWSNLLISSMIIGIEIFCMLIFFKDELLFQIFIKVKKIINNKKKDNKKYE